MLTEKRMKPVPNSNFARVTGIMTCRVKRELQRNWVRSRFQATVIHTEWAPPENNSRPPPSLPDRCLPASWN
jgi:hypothetical protein